MVYAIGNSQDGIENNHKHHDNDSKFTCIYDEIITTTLNHSFLNEFMIHEGNHFYIKYR